MATLEEMQTLERKYGDMVIRLAIVHLMDVGYRNFTQCTSKEEIEADIRKSRTESPAKGHAVLGEQFEISLCQAAFDLSRCCTPAEIIFWCARQSYFSVFEWEDHGEE